MHSFSHCSAYVKRYLKRKKEWKLENQRRMGKCVKSRDEIMLLYIKVGIQKTMWDVYTQCYNNNTDDKSAKYK